MIGRMPLTWEPPIGIEPMTYALREARPSALGVLPALMAAHASRNAPSAQGAPDPGPQSGALISAPRACGDAVRQPLGITVPDGCRSGYQSFDGCGLVHVVPGHVGGRW
jgi:hypothetical protein